MTVRGQLETLTVSYITHTSTLPRRMTLLLVLLLSVSLASSDENYTYFLTSEVGSITSPSYPSYYANNLHYRWLITAEPGTTIRLSFTRFNTEPCCDHLRVYDGPTEEYRLLLKRSGTYGLGADSTSNFMLITFTTDDSVVAPGFRGFYTARPNPASTELSPPSFSSCNHLLNAGTGSLTSPNYPDFYPSNTQCSWLITTESDSTVLLKFHDFKAFERGDYIRVYDGSSSSSAVVLEHSGYATPNPLESTSNSFLVTFMTGPSENSAWTGFNITYESLNRNNPDSTSALRAQPANCNNILDADSGFFTSPNYPNNYSNDIRCNWLIKTKPNNRIYLRIEHFSTEACCDFVKVYDGPTIKSNLIRYLIGHLQYGQRDFVQSASNSMLVTFTSDGSVVDQGFKASYVTVPGSEPGLFTIPERVSNTTFYWNEESGSFTSPNYPGNYSDNTYWQWQVWTPPGSTVRLQFHQFATERSCDRILVYKNWPDLANLLLVHSGHGIPPAVDSPSNGMTVVFETDYSVVSSGFSATFQALYEPTPGCDFTLDVESDGTFTSPNYPANYPENIRCRWLLRTPPGTNIQLTFDNFTTDGVNDRIQVYDGETRASTLLLEHGGYFIPESVESKSNVLLVTFYTDQYISLSGFSARFQAINPTPSSDSTTESMTTEPIPEFTHSTDSTTSGTNETLSETQETQSIESTTELMPTEPNTQLPLTDSTTFEMPVTHLDGANENLNQTPSTNLRDTI